MSRIYPWVVIAAHSDDSVHSEFSEDSTRPILQLACEKADLKSEGADLIRLGENALYRLRSDPVVVRIARTLDYSEDAGKEVHVARWLAAIEFPAARLHDIANQPFEVEDHPVTFWQYIAGTPGTRGNIEDLGALLHRLHSAQPTTEIHLPINDVLGRVSGRIKRAPVPSADKEFLLSRCEDLSEEISSLRFPLEPTVIHGDAHVQNLMVTDTEVALIDFERFAWGHPEWDLAVTATEYVTAGWWTPGEYERFVESYGFDVTRWSGFSLLRSVNEIKMTTWIMQNVQESDDIATEYGRRMQSIRTGRRGDWVPF